MQWDDLEKERLMPSKRMRRTPSRTNERRKTEINEDKPSRISSIEVSDHIEIFYSRLRRFSDRNEFDYYEFEREYEDLESILTMIEQWVIREGFQPRISKQLLFTKQAFNALMVSMNLILNIEDLKTPAYRFIRDVIGRKTTALTFFDSFGGLNHDIDYISEKVSFMSAELTSWESQFKFLDAVSIDLQMIFALEVDCVKNYIEELENELIKERREMEERKNKGLPSKWAQWG